VQIVAEVAHAAVGDKSGRRQAMLAHSCADGPLVRVHDIVVGSVAEDFLYSHMRPDGSRATKDLGEHASVALAATTLFDAVFVTMDKGAAYLALSELGVGRVASPFDYWHWLLQSGLIHNDVFTSLCECTHKGDGHLPGMPRRFRQP
jgi:hypothetical protein